MGSGDGTSSSVVHMPQENFYRHVHGQSTGRGEDAKQPQFTTHRMLVSRNESILKGILDRIGDEYVANLLQDEDLKSVGRFYALATRSTLSNAEDITPLLPYLSLVDTLQLHTLSPDFSALLARLHKVDIPVFFRLAPVLTAQSAYLPALFPHSLCARCLSPDDKDSAANKQTYRQLIFDVLMLINYTEVDAQALSADILVLEETLAAFQRGDGMRIPYTMRTLEKLLPVFDWRRYMKEIDLSGMGVLYAEKTFIEAFGKLLSTTDLHVLQAYIKWKITQNLAPFLNHRLRTLYEEFYAKMGPTHALFSFTNPVLKALNQYMGELLGKVYAQETVSTQLTADVTNISSAIKLSLANFLEETAMLYPPTKKKMLSSLDALTIRLITMDDWDGYQALPSLHEVDNYCEAALILRAFHTKRLWKKVGSRFSEEMSAPYLPQHHFPIYDKKRHTVWLPLGVLQPPYYQLHDSVPAATYGGIGSLLASELVGIIFGDIFTNDEASSPLRQHERDALAKRILQYASTHFLDDKASQSVEAVEAAEVVETAVAFESFKAILGLHVAYRAYLHTQTEISSAQTASLSTQMFFITWATAKNEVYIGSDGDFFRFPSPEHFVNGVLSGLTDFHEAFGVLEGMTMWQPMGERIVNTK